MSAPATRTEQERIVALTARAAEYAREVDRLRYEDRLSDFVAGGWSSIDSAQYKASWATDAICDHLEAVTFGHINRLLINVPPRASKTSICSICYPAWTWARSNVGYRSGPGVKFLCASYNKDLALINANQTRRLILSPWYQKYWGDKIKLRMDQNTKTQFDNTKNGSRVATSVGGSLLGIGGDIEVADDLHNTEKVEGEADRLKVVNFWKEFHSTRLNDPKQSAIIVVMQRLHVGDVSGVILDSDEEWTHLCLPMRFDERRRCVTVQLPQYDDQNPWTDPREEEGELLWPERFGEPEVANLEDTLGPYMASGRLQQMPTPKGGGIIMADWWKLWDQEEAAKYGLEWSGGLKEFPVPMEIVIGSLDTAFKEKEENSYSAMTVFGIFLDQAKNRRAMLMYAWQKRLPLHGRVLTALPGEAKVNFKQRQQKEWGLVEWVADTCRRYKINRLLIEDKARGVDVANEIRRLYARENWGVQLLNPCGDKVSRAHSVVPLFTDGAIYAPELRWSNMVIVECAEFPKGNFDDLVDTVTQAVGWMRDAGILIRADEATAALEDEATFRPPGASVAQQYGV